MSEAEFLKIKGDDLEEVVNFQAKSLVGKVCKRFEILDDKEDIKREAKELIYESYRELQKLIEAYSKGLHITQFKFDNQRKASPQ